MDDAQPNYHDFNNLLRSSSKMRLPFTILSWVGIKVGLHLPFLFPSVWALTNIAGYF